MTNGDIKVFGRFNALDFAIVLAAAVALAGFGLAKAGHAGVNSAIQGTKRINIDIYFSGFKTLDTGLFKVGEKSSLTIRNQPVKPPMDITAVRHTQKQVAFLAPNGKDAVSMDDPANPLAHDFVVTVADDADVTEDGYVVRGNKLKVGNQVELEGFKYRTQGVVVDIYPQDERPAGSAPAFGSKNASSSAPEPAATAPAAGGTAKNATGGKTAAGSKPKSEATR